MYRYLHLDVFTDRRFEGNQLAVFPEPQGLTTEQMQCIAKEMAFSESTFIFPPERRGDVRMRIFTPGSELPMAGHPTIGSTFALALEGTIQRGREQFVFELGVGPTPVSLEWDEKGLSFAWMTQPLPTFGPVVSDRDAFAAAIGLSARELLQGLPVQRVSCGVPFLFVPLATRAAVDAVEIDRKALARSTGSADLTELPVFFFTPERAGDGKRDGLQPDAGARLRHCGRSGDRCRERTARVIPAAPQARHPRRRAQHAQPAGRGDGTTEPCSHLDRQRRGSDHARARRRSLRARGTGRAVRSERTAAQLTRPRRPAPARRRTSRWRGRSR